MGWNDIKLNTYSERRYLQPTSVFWKKSIKFFGSDILQYLYTKILHHVFEEKHSYKIKENGTEGKHSKILWYFSSQAVKAIDILSK